ncbi:MAG: CDF family Co(II)/Ni(II) efflux transporter DmeF [Allosphingosinicella sp.]|uniref:CDF family Co(II)/Ni(II) efflux transporter DmeF n=1 Tax=Allosphingosinicella sp. TaxID=2823234 RepID=UPI00395DDEB7
MNQHQQRASDAHDHVYLSGREEHSERRTLLVILLTAATMVAEIGGGLLFGSMALLADGWHMASHVAALSLAFFAYRFARRHRTSRRYSWGTGKVGPLAGYTSAIVLGIVALLMAGESVHRLARPVEIDFAPAMLVAVLGLIVNLVSAWLLSGRGHDHGHGHSHGHAHGHAHGHHHHHDHNLRAAYYHVLADALTSLLAIFALSAGLYLGAAWLDPAMGLVGAAVILWWSAGLARGAARVLLDEEADASAADRIRARLEEGGEARVVDLHLWQVGPDHLALLVSLAAARPRHPDAYKARLAGIERLSHVTIEVVPEA